MFCFQERKVKYDARGKHRNKKISLKAKEKGAAPTGRQSMHGREGGKFAKQHKMETNA